ncbi:MAG: dienelactone hydrolase family protein [Rhodospirillales bacterium]
MVGTTVSIGATDGGSFSAYLASPENENAPGLVLMQYICGVNAVMRGLADAYAEEGYLVAVPDLFWRQEPNVQLLNDPSQPNPEEQQRALDFNNGFVDETAINDLKSTLAFVRNHSSCSGRAGALGYCLGGRTAYLMAARSDSDCTVGYYGVNIDTYLEEETNINSPLMLHIAGSDELCSPEAHDKIVGTLSKNANTTLYEYEGAGHAFALNGGHNFNPAAAQLANERSSAFLAEHLKK